MSKQIVLVNPLKVTRAKEIAGLLDGTVPVRTDEQVDLKAKFAELVKVEKVAKEDLVEFIYIKLGGLTRTVEENTAVEKKAAKRKASKKINVDEEKDEEGSDDDSDEDDE